MMPRRDVLLITGGQYHDFNYARLMLLQHAAAFAHMRVVVAERFDAEQISNASALITYTCGTLPDEATTACLDGWLRSGGRWLALHGTNSILDIQPDGLVRTPDLPPLLFDVLGSQFLAHPAPSRFRVRKTIEHPLTHGIESFFVDDEHYLQRHAEGNIVLFETEFEGETKLFSNRHWAKSRHQTAYLRPRGDGGVFYLTLGHARGPYDMRPITENYPFYERGAWEHPSFNMLIRRGFHWLDRDTTYE